MSDEKELVSTPGFIVACMNCHNGKGTEADTEEEALKMAKIHLSIEEKPHGGHTVAITPTTLIRRKK
jgi:hypothetical protein